MNSSPKPLLERAFDVMVTVVIIAVGLSWAWHLLRPLLPAIAAVAVVVVVVRYVRARNEW